MTFIYVDHIVLIARYMYIQVRKSLGPYPVLQDVTNPLGYLKLEQGLWCLRNTHYPVPALLQLRCCPNLSALVPNRSSLGISF